MPLLRNAKKALRVSARKTELNKPIKSRAKTAVDAMHATPSAKLLTEAFSAIDRAVKSHLFHKNKAARLKSRAAKLLKSA